MTSSCLCSCVVCSVGKGRRQWGGGGGVGVYVPLGVMPYDDDALGRDNRSVSRYLCPSQAQNHHTNVAATPRQWPSRQARLL